MVRMKLLVAALGLVLVGGAAFAQSQKKVVVPLAPPPDAPAQPEQLPSAPRPSTPTAPAKKETAPAASAKKADAKKENEKETPPPPMEGIVVARGERGYIGIAVVNGTFVIKFYDDKKRAKTPDVAQVALRWEPKNRSIIERTLLTPAGANIVTSSKVVLAPFNFQLYITMLGDGGAATGENHVITFQQ